MKNETARAATLANAAAAVMRGFARRARDVVALLLLATSLPARAQPPAVEVTETPEDPACRQTGSRARAPCETARTVVTLEREMSFSVAPPPVKRVQCAAAIELEYTQRDSRVRVTRTLNHRDCAASSGEYTLVVRVRGADGQSETLEFPVAWQRSDAAPIVASSEYDIGESVDLLGVRTRQTRCTCTDAPSADLDPP